MGIDDSINFCRALGDPTRLRLVRLLATYNEEACLCELEKSLVEPAYKISRHLKILRDAGVLDGEKEGRWVYHRVASEPECLKHLVEFVLAQPDEAGIYADDLRRFEALQACRISGRCRGNDKLDENEDAKAVCCS